MKCYSFHIRATATPENPAAGTALYANTIIWALGNSLGDARIKAHDFLKQRHWHPEHEQLVEETSVRQHPGNKTSSMEHASFVMKQRQRDLLYRLRRSGVSGEIYVVEQSEAAAVPIIQRP